MDTSCSKAVPGEAAAALERNAGFVAAANMDIEAERTPYLHSGVSSLA
jgi:hypothetical protein